MRAPVRITEHHESRLSSRWRAAGSRGDGSPSPRVDHPDPCSPCSGAAPDERHPSSGARRRAWAWRPRIGVGRLGCACAGPRDAVHPDGPRARAV